VPLDTVGNGGMEMVGIGPTKYAEKIKEISKEIEI